MQEATMSAPRMPIVCKKNTPRSAWFSIGGTLQRAPFFASFSPSLTPFLFFAATPCRAAPETPAVGGETFFHGRGCAPTCGMRHGSPIESFLMTDKTTDRTWTGAGGGGKEGINCIYFEFRSFSF